MAPNDYLKLGKHVDPVTFTALGRGAAGNDRTGDPTSAAQGNITAELNTAPKPDTAVGIQLLARSNNKEATPSHNGDPEVKIVAEDNRHINANLNAKNSNDINATLNSESSNDINATLNAESGNDINATLNADEDNGGVKQSNEPDAAKEIPIYWINREKIRENIASWGEAVTAMYEYVIDQPIRVFKEWLRNRDSEIQKPKNWINKAPEQQKHDASQGQAETTSATQEQPATVSQTAPTPVDPIVPQPGLSSIVANPESDETGQANSKQDLKKKMVS